MPVCLWVGRAWNKVQFGIELYIFSKAKLLLLVLCSLKNVFRLQNRCAVVGNVDAGKSTLLGVLTHGELDNGRGYARQKLFRHKHEAESGRTSSVGNDILGFDSSGQVVNKPDHGNLDWIRYVQNTMQQYTVTYSRFLEN